MIIRDDLLARSDTDLPTMLSYKVQAENNSLYNTPNTFGIYILGLVTQVAEIARRAAGDRADQPAQGGDAVLGDRSHGLLSRHRAEGQPVADEHHVSSSE